MRKHRLYAAGFATEIAFGFIIGKTDIKLQNLYIDLLVCNSKVIDEYSAQFWLAQVRKNLLVSELYLLGLHV